MPKQKITKEMIIETAFEIVRKEGLENLLVKNIAAKLNCSVQPIYSYCANMEGVKQELVARTAKFIREFSQYGAVLLEICKRRAQFVSALFLTAAA